MARGEGIGFVNFHPLQPLMRLAREDAEDEELLVVMVDGTSLGTIAPEVAVAIFESLDDIRFDVVVHSLLGHRPEFIGELMSLPSRGKAIVWAHDHFLLCPNYTLQRNAISFCDAPAPTSQACGICKFGAERQTHLPRIASLLGQRDVEVVAPSEWQRQYLEDRSTIDLPGLTALPHADLEPASTPAGPREGAVRLGFAGTPARHKGWQDFVRLADTVRRDPDFECLFFGLNDPEGAIRKVEVAVTDRAPDAMSDAIAAEGIDLVVMWMHWPETFSFVAHEVLAAGAFIITNDRSGNVAALVERTGRGIVLPFDTNLADWIHGEDCAALVARRRAAAGEVFELVRSKKSFAHLETGDAA